MIVLVTHLFLWSFLHDVQSAVTDVSVKCLLHRCQRSVHDEFTFWRKVQRNISLHSAKKERLQYLKDNANEKKLFSGH